MNESPPYSYHCFIPFHLADPAGILFFGHVFTLAHQAFEQFIVEQLRSPWTDWFQHPEWIVPIKHAEATYSYPIRVGQNCLIQLTIEAISTSSLTLASNFTQDTTLCCSVKTVHLFCSRSTKQKIPVPPLFLSRLNACSTSSGAGYIKRS